MTKEPEVDTALCKRVHTKTIGTTGLIHFKKRSFPTCTQEKFELVAICNISANSKPKPPNPAELLI